MSEEGRRKIQLGKRGEALAEAFLKSRGYRILGRNVKAKFGEIDLVAQDGTVLSFIEVKAGTSLTFGWPEERLTRAKIWRMSRLASWYLLRHPSRTGPIRFDVVSVLISSDGDTPARMRLIQGAFEV